MVAESEKRCAANVCFLLAGLSWSFPRGSARVKILGTEGLAEMTFGLQ